MNALAKFCRKRPLYACCHLEKFPCHNATLDNNLQATDSETTIELNLAVLKVKHTG